jgi:hypothetical protein
MAKLGYFDALTHVGALKYHRFRGIGVQEVFGGRVGIAPPLARDEHSPHIQNLEGLPAWRDRSLARLGRETEGETERSSVREVRVQAC